MLLHTGKQLVLDSPKGPFVLCSCSIKYWPNIKLRTMEYNFVCVFLYAGKRKPYFLLGCIGTAVDNTYLSRLKGVKCVGVLKSKQVLDRQFCSLFVECQSTFGNLTPASQYGPNSYTIIFYPI